MWTPNGDGVDGNCGCTLRLSVAGETT